MTKREAKSLKVGDKIWYVSEFWGLRFPLEAPQLATRVYYMNELREYLVKEIEGDGRLVLAHPCGRPYGKMYPISLVRANGATDEYVISRGKADKMVADGNARLRQRRIDELQAEMEKVV